MAGRLASKLIALSTEWGDELPLARQVSLRLQLLRSGNIHFHQLRCAQPEPNSGQKNGGCIGAKQAPVDSDRSDLGIRVNLSRWLLAEQAGSGASDQMAYTRHSICCAMLA